MHNPNILDPLFREAVSAIDAGDVTTLERLPTMHLKLVRDHLDSLSAWLRDKVGDALEVGVELGTRDKIYDETPLGWAEYGKHTELREKGGQE